MLDINALLEQNPVVPLVQADDPEIAVKTSRALAAGGLSVVEVVFRTDRALECLQAVADEVPEIVAGVDEYAVARDDAAPDFGVRRGGDPGIHLACEIDRGNAARSARPSSTARATASSARSPAASRATIAWGSARDTLRSIAPQSAPRR